MILVLWVKFQKLVLLNEEQRTRKREEDEETI